MTRPPTSRAPVLQLTEAQLERMLAEAGERGGRRALEAVGLSDPDAGRDVRDVRDLMSAWRETKREAGRTAVRVLVTALLGLMAASLWLYAVTHRPH